MARACLLSSGVRLEFGGFEEHLAITHVLRERQIRKVEALIASGLNHQFVQALMKSYDEIAFPELESERLRYMAKAKTTMDSLKGKKLKMYTLE